MKKKYLWMVLLWAIFACHASAKSGPKIVYPELSIESALGIARAHIINDDVLVDRNLARPSEYVVIRVEIFKSIHKGIKKNGWRIKFTHPIYNDHSVDYVVISPSDIIRLQVTE